MTAPPRWNAPTGPLPADTEPVHLCLHVPRQMAALAVVTLVDDLATRLNGIWEYRHPLGAQIGTYHIHLQERRP